MRSVLMAVLVALGVCCGVTQADAFTIVVKIDATTVSYATWMALSEKTDLHVILDKEHYVADAPVIPKVNVMRADAGPETRSEAVKVTAALIAIARDLAPDPARWAQAMSAARPDVPQQILRSLGSSYARDWCVDGCFGRRALERSAAVLVGPAAAPVADWADFSVLKDALSQLDRHASQ